ncbi:glycoside hydrolase family 3 protein [Luteipulveratus flavus]|uniref:beta-N-acetylhexosaminidase n=1 Tax=Luteipulveratus flavus TaxID=3031728 RepID=A0ABT6C4G2_9MICO|nr:glycoside hydrolase family 3 N-terminal domain-containing protein [Luteipulveratus sp. YIM 133296]MDF8263172.1 glycoside hydrolase family 3 N-terminal domain-containing protein [Luteipulveratus sp. YIM 133296]
MPSTRGGLLSRAAGAVCVAALLASCSGGDDGAAAPATSTFSTARSASPTRTAPTAPTAPVPPTAGPSSSAPAPTGVGVPTDAELAAARKDVSRLPTERLAAQLIVGFYDGSSPDAAARAISGDHLGGVILFPGNVPSSASLVSGLRSGAERAQQAMRADGRDWPAIVSVDQEGGPVARLGAPVTELPSGMAYGAADDPALATRVAHGIGEELRALGMTMVFSPDADVTIGAQDPTIGVRSPGSDPQRVARTATAQARGYAQAGVVPVAKHFPGHGSVTTDSHIGLPRQRASLDALRGRDLVPFQALVRDGAPAVMSAHIVLDALDAGAPSTMSRPVLTGLLRQQLGFKGLIVTDALQMGAVDQRYGSGRGAVQAVAAGADVLLMPADPGASVTALTKAVASGQLTRDRLVESAARIVATMRRAGSAQQPPASAVGAHHADALALARASVTQISGPCGAAAVTGGVRISGGTQADRSRFGAAARRAGLRVGSGTTVRLLGGGAYNAGTGESSGSQGGTGRVMVGLDTPYALRGGPAGATRIAAYGRTPETFQAVVEVLTGKRKATGRLPVAVGRWKAGSGC